MERHQLRDGAGRGAGLRRPQAGARRGPPLPRHLHGDAHDIWYADTAGGSWSRPIRVPDGRGKGSLGSSYSIAASNGVAYIAYPVVARPYHDGYEDIYLATHAPGAGGAFAVGQVTQDPDNCAKYAPALVARAGRLGLAYLFGNKYNSECASDDHSPAAKMGAHMLTGTPGHWVEAPLGLVGTLNVCETPALSSDSDLFRLTAGCHRGEGSDDYYYKAEFLDVVGPTTRLRAPATATAPSIALSWSARNPTPGSGVSSYDLQVKRDNGAWQDLTPAGTRSTSYVYTHATGGRSYTFRLRARDGVNNWGDWMSATTRVA